MRILVISDIHANLQALEAVFKDAGTVDAIWCAGDIVDFGINPHEVVTWCRDHEVCCVSGNHDRRLLRKLDAGEADLLRGTDRYKWVHDNIDRMTEEDFGYLRQLPLHLTLEADGIVYLMQHQMGEGDKVYVVPENLEQFETFWQAHVSGEPDPALPRRMIFGHTHRRCVHQLDKDRLWLNPGSASYRRPDDHDKRAHYMIIDGGQIEFHAVPYDRTPSYLYTLGYARSGKMLMTDLQDAMFFFGNAETTRDPICLDNI